MRIAVALHLFSYEPLDEFAKDLQNIRRPYDLFVTVPDAGAPVRTRFPRAHIYPHHPNRGMDIGGFFAVLPAILEGNYTVVLKLHSKTSPIWRRGLVDPICGSSASVAKCLKLLKDPSVGMVGAKSWTVGAETGWTTNHDMYVAEFGAKWNVRPMRCRFVGGTIFWMKVSALRAAFGKNFNFREVFATLNTLDTLDWVWYTRHYADLLQRGVSTKELAIRHWARFGKREGRYPNGLALRASGKTAQLDGLREHAFERFFGVIVESKGFRLLTV